jgi:hypothetical protein
VAADVMTNTAASPPSASVTISAATLPADFVVAPASSAPPSASVARDVHFGAPAAHVLLLPPFLCSCPIYLEGPRLARS